MVRVDLRSELVVPARNEVTLPRGDESILPISSAPSDSRGGPAWIVAGVCALAISAFVSLKLKPVEASPPVEPEWAATPPAAASAPEPAVPPPIKDELEDKQVIEQALPLVNGAAQAEPVPDQSAPAAAPEAKPAEPAAPATRVQSAWAARKARREERQRRGHEYTLALNLEGSAGQQTGTSAQSSEPAPEPVPMMTQAAAPKSPIPDNPY